jgi:hypothetical protein
VKINSLPLILCKFWRNLPAKARIRPILKIDHYLWSLFMQEKSIMNDRISLAFDIANRSLQTLRAGLSLQSHTDLERDGVIQ